MDTVDLISSHDTFYMWQSDDQTYSKGEASKNEIYEQLEGMPYDKLVQLYESLSASVKDNYIGKKVASLVEEKTPPPASARKTSRSDIMTIAWGMYKAEVFASFGDAQRAAWQRFKLLSQLRSGVAHFSYTKANGALREAIGTLREGIYHYEAKGSNRPNAPHVVKYFDLGSKAFRSVRIDRLINIAA